MLDGPLTSVGSLALIMLLGIRHGFDPDHLACIDSFSISLAQRRPQLARFLGAIFAAGHGLTITLLTLAFGHFGQQYKDAAALVGILDWLPSVLLLLLGALGLAGLRRREHSHGALLWMNRHLGSRVGIAGIFITGVVFAAAFDTATQATMWSYVLSTGGGMLPALWAGLTFTAGMMLTDLADSMATARAASNTPRRTSSGFNDRYAIRLLVVAYSLALGVYGLLRNAMPAMELGDVTYTAIGIFMFLIIVTIGLRSGRRAPA